jgi:hypothetical protein
MNLFHEFTVSSLRLFMAIHIRSYAFGWINNRLINVSFNANISNLSTADLTSK